MELFARENKAFRDKKRIYAIQKGITNKGSAFDRLRRLAIEELKKERS